jgi:hypothetical protein
VNSDFLIPDTALPGTLVQSLRDQNPCWEEPPLPIVPEYRRWPFDKLLARLRKPLGRFSSSVVRVKSAKPRRNCNCWRSLEIRDPPDAKHVIIAAFTRENT